MPNIDPQANGWKDDGSESGRVRTDALSDLARVPFRRSNTSTPSIVGTGFVQYNEEGAAGNPDKSGMQLNIQLTKAAIGSGNGAAATLTHFFRGTKYGLYGLQNHQNGLGTFPFSVIIDGVAYGVPNRMPNKLADQSNPGAMYDPLLPMFYVDNLPDGEHQVDLVLVAPDSSNTTNGSTATYVLFGFLAERRYGYADPTPRQLAITGSLTASAVRLPINPNTSYNWSVYPGNEFSYFTGITYTNTDSVTRTVTVKKGGNIVWQKQIAAGDSDMFTPPAPGPVSYDGTSSTAALKWEHFCDVGTLVNYILFGGRH